MKRNEATPELLKALEDPENIYAFEEDYIEIRLVSGYIRRYKKWSTSNGLSAEQKNEVSLFLEKALKVIEKRIELGLLKDEFQDICAFLDQFTIEEILEMYEEYFNV